MSTPERSYETASARIEEIIKRLDSGEAGLRETLELVREGRELVELCAGELEAVGRGLEELRLDELVARLEAGGSGGSASAWRPAEGLAASSSSCTISGLSPEIARRFSRNGIASSGRSERLSAVPRLKSAKA